MYRVGVDLGGTNISIGLVNEKYELVGQLSTPTLPERASDVVIGDMIQTIEQLLKNCKVELSQVESIGVGSPGTINNAEGVILRSYNLNWFDVPLADILSRHFHLPVHVDNDANVAALAETVCGAAVGYPYVVVITLGTGVGGGIIINNKIYSGMNGAGAELGHMAITNGGEMCTCGRAGCWEAYACAGALMKQAKTAAKEHPESKLNTIEIRGAKDVFDTAAAGDETAVQVVKQYAEYVAIGLTDIVNILAPNIILLGGGVSKSAPVLLPYIIDYVQNHCFGQKDRQLPIITTAKLGNDAGIIGAAAL